MHSGEVATHGGGVVRQVENRRKQGWQRNSRLFPGNCHPRGYPNPISQAKGTVTDNATNPNRLLETTFSKRFECSKPSHIRAGAYTDVRNCPDVALGTK